MEGPEFLRSTFFNRAFGGTFYPIWGMSYVRLMYDKTTQQRAETPNKDASRFHS
jgi:hypothetical protein